MVSPTILVAIGSSIASTIASLGTAIFLNRRKINEVTNWAWGRDRDECDQGVAGRARSLDERIETIDSKLDEAQEEREREHEEVEAELRRTRLFVHETTQNLIVALNSETEAELDPSEIKPNREYPGDRSLDDLSEGDN